MHAHFVIYVVRISVYLKSTCTSNIHSLRVLCTVPCMASEVSTVMASEVSTVMASEFSTVMASEVSTVMASEFSTVMASEVSTVMASEISTVGVYQWISMVTSNHLISLWLV